MFTLIIETHKISKSNCGNDEVREAHLIHNDVDAESPSEFTQGALSQDMRYTYRKRIVDEVAENEHNQDSPCDSRCFSLQDRIKDGVRI